MSALKTLFKKAGVPVGDTRGSLNLIEGTNVTLTMTDDGPNDAMNVTIAASGAAGAPSDADYLVGTANAGLSAEIVVGTTPGGELGGTWAAPTVDATHSGSAHHAQLHAASHEPGGGDAMTVDAVAATGSLRTLGAGAQQASAGNHSHAGAGHTIQDDAVAMTQRANLSFQDGFVLADNVGANSTDVDVSYATVTELVDVTKAAEAAGTSLTVARGDHKHDVTTAAPTAAIDIGDAAAEGTATTLMRSDAQLSFPAPVAGYPVDTTFAAEADGTATTPARSDHRHTITDPTTLPAAIAYGTAASAEGTSTDVARADHNHGSTQTFTISSTYKTPAVDDYVVWRAPFACTVTALRGYVDVGTTTAVNAFKGSLATPTNFSTANMTITAADSWISDTTLDVTAVAAGDAVGFRITTIGTAGEVTIQIDLTRP